MSQKAATDLSPKATLIMGSITILAGSILVGVAMDWIPSDPNQMHAPHWTVAATGLVFVFGGLAILAAHYSRLSAFFVGCLCLSMAAVGFWAAFIADQDTMQGGIPLVPRWINVGFGRMLITFGIFLASAMAFMAFKQSFSAKRSSDPHRSTREDAGGSDD